MQAVPAILAIGGKALAGAKALGGAALTGAKALGGAVGPALKTGATALQAGRLLGPKSPLVTGDIAASDIASILKTSDFISGLRGESEIISREKTAKRALEGAVQGAAGGALKKSGFFGIK